MRAALTVALALCCAIASGEPRHLAVAEAVTLALQTNPRLRSAEARLRGGGDLARSVGARMLPSVHLAEEYQHWDSAFLIPFGPITLQPRDQNTNTFAAAVDQPLVGLLHLAEDYRAQRAATAAGSVGYRAAEASLREAIEVGYLRYFEARALEAIARSSEAELADQIAVAEARVKAGVLTNADVLRVQVAAANARQQEIAARGQADIAHANLMSAVGLPPDDASVILDEPTALLAAARDVVPAYRDAEARAGARRPEVEQSRLLVESTAHQRRARLLALLPEVDAEAAYVRIDGQIFAPKDSAYVGVKAKWAIWEWGASYYAERAAAAQAEAAELDLEETRRRIATEVKTTLSQSDAATAFVDVAEKTIASAEEAYRVTDALLKAGAATTTDLLDAQSALSGARLNLTRARYEQAIARVALSRVMGD